MSTQIMNKDEQTNTLKRKKKKNEMLLDSNPHLLGAKDNYLSIRLSRNCDFFSFIKVIVPQSKHTFNEDCRRLEERPLNMHMSQVNVDKQYTVL